MAPSRTNFRKMFLESPGSKENHAETSGSQRYKPGDRPGVDCHSWFVSYSDGLFWTRNDGYSQVRDHVSHSSLLILTVVLKSSG